MHYIYDQSEAVRKGYVLDKDTYHDGTERYIHPDNVSVLPKIAGLDCPIGNREFFLLNLHISQAASTHG